MERVVAAIKGERKLTWRDAWDNAQKIAALTVFGTSLVTLVGFISHQFQAPTVERTSRQHAMHEALVVVDERLLELLEAVATDPALARRLQAAHSAIAVARIRLEYDGPPAASNPKPEDRQ